MCLAAASQRPFQSRGPLLGVLIVFHVLLPSSTRGEGPWFLRADANVDGDLDVSDGVMLLQYLFDDGVELPCRAAADSNADRHLDISDAVYIFNHLFLGGSRPPEPFPDCGPNTSGESEADPAGRAALSCDRFPPCADFTLHGDPGLGTSEPDRAAGEFFTATHNEDEALVLRPEFFDAISLLARGESIHALRGVPGYDDFLAQIVADGAGAQESHPEQLYTPSVVITARVDHEGPLRFEGGLLNAISEEVRSAAEAQGAARRLSWISEVVPSEVKGSGSHDILLVETGADGSRVMRSGRAVLCHKSDSACPTEPQIVVQLASTKCGERVRCRWNLSTECQPRQLTAQERTWDYLGNVTSVTSTYPGSPPSVGNDGWMLIQGEGPWHVVLARRNRVNCFSLPTAVSEVAMSDCLVRIGIVCFDVDREVVCKTANHCTPQVWSFADYESEVRIFTHTGGNCAFFGANTIEALAQDETSFRANEESIFTKGVVVQNGSVVTTPVTLELGADLGGPPQPEIAGDADVTFGYSKDVTDQPGSSADRLVAHGSDVRTPPVLLRLESQGAAQLDAGNRALGTVTVHTSSWYLVYAGTGCDSAGVLSGGILIADKDRSEEKRQEAGSYLKSVTGVDVTWLRETE